MGVAFDPPRVGVAPIGRRLVLLGAVGGVGAIVAGQASPTPGQAAGGAPERFGLTVAPREWWADDLAPTGPMAIEAPGDVKFLLVHHTVNANDYPPAAVPGLLQGIYRAHTGEKGWPDVAYNFFVDQHGGVWEGRAGSLTGPVKGDATGGSQGFAMLCSFVGDHRTVPPTPAAADSMVRLLAWQADTYGIDTTPGATTEFVSRGSNKHPAGATVTTTTIAGHRDMSSTECPGDAAYRLVLEDFPPRVALLRVATTTPTTTVTTAPTIPGSTASTVAVSGEEAGAPGSSGGSTGVPWVAAGVGGACGLALLGGIIGLRSRRQRA